MQRIDLQLRRVLVFAFYFLSSLLVSRAQNISYMSHAPVPGDSLTFQKADYADPGPSGIGQVWDFYQLIPDGVPIIKKYFIPNNLPNSKFDPLTKCNLAHGATNYLTCDSTGLYALGQGERLYKWNLPDTITPNPVRDLILKFPFQLNDSIRSWSSYYSGSFPDNVYSNVLRTYIFADATGTLITPCGTYTNTIRIYRKTNYATLYTKASSASSTAYTDVDSYEWYVPGIHGSLLSICSSTSYSWWTPSTSSKWSIVYNDLQKNPLGIPANSLLEFKDFHFQNPASDYLNISLEDNELSNYNIQIIDLSGKTILTDVFVDKTHTLDISILSAGMYLIQLQKEDGSIGRKKLLIEH